MLHLLRNFVPVNFPQTFAIKNSDSRVGPTGEAFRTPESNNLCNLVQGVCCWLCGALVGGG